MFAPQWCTQVSLRGVRQMEDKKMHFVLFMRILALMEHHMHPALFPVSSLTPFFSISVHYFFFLTLTSTPPLAAVLPYPVHSLPKWTECWGRVREGERESIYGQTESTLQVLIIYSDLQPQANHSCRDERESRGGKHKDIDSLLCLLTVPGCCAKLFEV